MHRFHLGMKSFDTIRAAAPAPVYGQANRIKMQSTCRPVGLSLGEFLRQAGQCQRPPLETLNKSMENRRKALTGCQKPESNDQHDQITRPQEPVESKIQRQSIPVQRPDTSKKETNLTLPEKVFSDNLNDAPESNWMPKVTADKNYEANYDSDISFRKGDILQLISEIEVEGWCFVRNLITEKEGYVPTTFVTKITDCDVESQKFFFKELDREEAEEKLLEKDVELGTYLLRPSEDDYALSLRCESELYELDIRHYKVCVAEIGICYIEVDSKKKHFINITDLIKYYTENPGLRCKLKKPLPQDIPLDDLAVKFSDLKLGEKFGSGYFDFMRAGILHKTKQVAVKSLREGGAMTVEDFRKEAETMHKLRHPNLVSLLAICEDSGQIYIIAERMSKGALLNLLREDTDNKTSFKDLMGMAIQVVNGMCYMEKKRFVHRDLRAANVLVGDGNITKIANFGLARLLNNNCEHEGFYEDNKKIVMIPLRWTALESIRQRRFTVKSDVWSLGILLYEMLTHGSVPYAAMTVEDAIDWVERGNRLARPTERHCPVTLYNIMKDCWLTLPKERPSFADIKETLIEIKSNR